MGRCLVKKIGIVLFLVIIMALVGCEKKKDGINEDKNDDNKITSSIITDTTGSKAEDTSNEKESTETMTRKVPIQIKIWHDKEEQVAAVLQKELDKLAPDIVVVLEKKEGLTDSLKLVGNDSKSAPDMYFFAHDKIGVYAEMGILAPITDFISKDVLESFVDVTVSAVTYKESVYQLPIYFETLLFMYNKEFMSKEDVPTTTEELYRYITENNTGERYGFVEQHSTAYYSVPWIHGFGGKLLSDDGSPGLDAPETIEALKYHKKFVDYMPGESDYNTVNILFMNGMADSIIGGPWLVPSVRAKNIDLGFAKMPVVESTGLPLAPYSGVQGVHVLKVAADTKKDAITEILTQLINPDIGIAMANASGCAPANELCYVDDSVKQDEMVMMMKQTAESAIPMPNIPEMDVMWSVTDNLLVTTNMKNGDPEKEAKKAQKNAVNLIEKMR